jgi:LppP/LprE lipoprotein
MGGMASTARGPRVVRHRRRPPRRVRWGRRIAGILGTAALLGVAVLMGTMLAPSRDATPRLPRTPVAPAKAKSKPKPKPKAPQLTAAQRAARADAVSVLRTQGYVAARPKDYNPRHQLRVLVGYRSGDPLGPRRAFFFAGTRFVGNDVVDGSSQVKVVSSGRRWVTLAYGVFAPGGNRCCPVSTTKVRFTWNGSALAPQSTIPVGRLATG